MCAKLRRAETSHFESSRNICTMYSKEPSAFIINTRFHTSQWQRALAVWLSLNKETADAVHVLPRVGARHTCFDPSGCASRRFCREGRRADSLVQECPRATP